MKQVTVDEFSDFIFSGPYMCYNDKDDIHLLHYYDEYTKVEVACAYSYPKSCYNSYYIME